MHEKNPFYPQLKPHWEKLPNKSSSLTKSLLINAIVNLISQQLLHAYAH